PRDDRVTGHAPAEPAATSVRGPKGPLLRLPFTRAEAQEIARALPAGAVRSYLDFDASRATALSDQVAHSSVVHFATHALIDTERPAGSGIVLSLVDRQGRSQDGFLRLRDVYNLRLSADMVVLSACESALGESVRGEGLVGLTRGFMYAG